jgi:hypothetical protein
MTYKVYPIRQIKFDGKKEKPVPYLPSKYQQVKVLNNEIELLPLFYLYNNKGLLVKPIQSAFSIIS